MKNKKAQKKIPRVSKRRLVVFGSLSVIAFIVLCITGVRYTYKIIDLSREQKELTKQLDDLKTQHEDLLVEIEKLKDPAYLANYAREKYLYSKDGEYVIKIDETQQKISDIEKSNLKYKYVIASTVLLFGIAVLVVIKKKVF